MIIKTNYIAISLLGLCAYSCLKSKTCKQKDQVCDNAGVILGNQTKDTIFFGIGKNYYDDTLLPGKNKVYEGGGVNVTYDSKNSCEQKLTSWSIWSIDSDHGTWALNVDHCVKKSTFKYDNGSSGTVSLYEDSQD